MSHRLLTRSLKQKTAVGLQSARHLNMRLTLNGKKSIDRIAGYHELYSGNTCIILGNGPSIKNLNPESLNNYTTFCLNRGYLLWRKKTSHPTFYMAVNDLVVKQFYNEISELDCPLFLPWAHRNLFPGHPNAIFLRIRWDRTFQKNATQGVWPGATVTVAALQMAYHMGFSQVILLGIDHRFETKGKPHSEIQQDGSDPNHFHPDYFGHGTLWNLPDLEQSEAAYTLAKHVFESDGREIINATPGSALNIFRKEDLSEVL